MVRVEAVGERERERESDSQPYATQPDMKPIAGLICTSVIL